MDEPLTKPSVRSGEHEFVNRHLALLFSQHEMETILEKRLQHHTDFVRMRLVSGRRDNIEAIR